MERHSRSAIPRIVAADPQFRELRVVVVPSFENRLEALVRALSAHSLS